MTRIGRWFAIGIVFVMALAVTGVAVAAPPPPSSANSVGSPVKAGPPTTAPASCPWLNEHLSITQRVHELLSAMTLSQKIDEMHAHVPTPGSQFAGFEGYLAAQPSLCIPPLVEQDDSAGVADGLKGVTQLPAPVTLASAWSRTLAYEYGAVNGAEHFGKGAAMALGPGINIQRNPRWGRNFEMLSEDPYLSGHLGVADTEGIQSQGVMADVKHYDAYNQETNRNTPADDDIVSERALHEIYMPSFDTVVKHADPASIMCSYATVNGQYSCQNPYLLTTTLDEQFGFQGFVRSDGGANHSTVASVNAGLDQEKGSNYFTPALLTAAVNDGQVKMATINSAVGRILTQMFRFGLFNHPPTGNAATVVTTPAHAAFAQKTAEEGTVLLKNADGILPLSPQTVGSITVIGADGGTSPLTAGGGSSYVTPPYVISPYQGIKALASKDGIPVAYSEGVPASGGLATAPSQEFTVPETGTYQFSLTSSGPGSISVDGRPVITPSGRAPVGPAVPTTKTGTIELKVGERVPVKATYAATAGPNSPSSAAIRWQVIVPASKAASMRAAAVQAASKSNVAIVFASNYESEGADLPNITLQDNQDQLISAVAQANPNTIVVLNTGGPVVMPWISQVKAVIEAWYAGQQDGNAIAAVLFGNVDPAGHLTETFPVSYSQVPSSSPAQFPGVNGKVLYSEGIFVGYRWYDAHHITPLFPFGYGLSYTTFGFSHLTVSPGSTTSLGTIRVGATVTNTGTRAGADVAQLYVGDPAATGEPPRQLKGFQRVSLAPGQSTRVHFTLDARDLSYWDTAANGWVEDPGTYGIYVGDSSAMANLPLQSSVVVTQTTGTRQLTISAPPAVDPAAPFTVTATLSPGGTLTLHGVQFHLATPSGWQVRPTANPITPSLVPAQPASASWSVTPPAGAQDADALLTATVDFAGTGTTSCPADGPSGPASAPSAPPTPGAASCSSGEHASQLVEVRPLVSTSVTPTTILADPGSSATFTGALHSNSAGPVTVSWTASPPSGITIIPSAGSTILAGGASAILPFSVRVASTASPGNYPLTVRLTATVAPGPGARPTATVYPLLGFHVDLSIPYPSLAATFDNVGISSNSDVSTGNFDGYGNSYSAQALASAGLTAGASVTQDGATVTWPNVPAGTPDNVLANGQSIALRGSGSTLVFLGASADDEPLTTDPVTGSGTIYYTDGTSQSFSLSLDNWFYQTPTTGDAIVVSVPYINDADHRGNVNATGQRTQEVSVYATSVPLEVGKSVEAIVLPTISGRASPGIPAMHVFAVGVSGG